MHLGWECSGAYAELLHQSGPYNHRKTWRHACEQEHLYRTAPAFKHVPAVAIQKFKAFCCCRFLPCKVLSAPCISRSSQCIPIRLDRAWAGCTTIKNSTSRWVVSLRGRSGIHRDHLYWCILKVFLGNKVLPWSVWLAVMTRLSP